jgi:hypothetical protein
MVSGMVRGEYGEAAAEAAEPTGGGDIERR